jgi:peptidyl-tRNA hydrolase
MEMSPDAEDEDLDEVVPWAMQLVARIEREERPTRTAVCEAAAIAVVQLLADERSQPGGPWADAVEHWATRRIRKIVRRARASAWERAGELPGVTVAHRGAEVRAFVPSPVDAVPAAIAKLQLQGFDLDDPDERVAPAPRDGGPVVVAIAPDPPLSVGKAAAAAGHAAQLARDAMGDDRRRLWAAAGYAVEVGWPDPDRWSRIVREAQVVVVDGGFTEVAPGATTALACWH